MRGGIASPGTMTNCQPRLMSRGVGRFRGITAVTWHACRRRMGLSGAKAAQWNMVDDADPDLNTQSAPGSSSPEVQYWLAYLPKVGRWSGRTVPT